jgi:hypothetical protein
VASLIVSQHYVTAELSLHGNYSYQQVV